MHSLISSCKVSYMLITGKLQLYIILAFCIPLLSYVRNCFNIILFNMSKRHHDRTIPKKTFLEKNYSKVLREYLKIYDGAYNLQKKVRKFCQKKNRKVREFYYPKSLDTQNKIRFSHRGTCSILGFENRNKWRRAGFWKSQRGVHVEQIELYWGSQTIKEIIRMISSTRIA